MKESLSKFLENLKKAREAQFARLSEEERLKIKLEILSSRGGIIKEKNINNEKTNQ